MHIHVSFAGIHIQLKFPEDVTFDPWLESFFADEKEEADIIVEFQWGKTAIPQGKYMGENILQSYYINENTWYCVLKGSAECPVSVTSYDSELTNIVCTMGDFVRQWKAVSLMNALQMLPMHAILQKFDVLFFHASQIQVGKKGVLFTAPSGTGKTTQARLWSTYRGAKIVCNDRTPVRGDKTFGYPSDGANPIRWNGSIDLGAIVLLNQAAENKVQRLRPSQAISALMGQLVIDHWNPKAVETAMIGLSELVERYPIYRLSCTPDENSVSCMEKYLLEDGVIEYEGI